MEGLGFTVISTAKALLQTFSGSFDYLLNGLFAVVRDVWKSVTNLICLF